MVIDTSALLAIVFNEDHGSWVADRLESSKTALRMSTVNFAEYIIICNHRQPKYAEELEREILTRGIRFIPPNIEHSKIAAKARRKYPLNLGDCFAYALTKHESCSIITLDRDFINTDLDVISP